jgi:hypothetical protein
MDDEIAMRKRHWKFVKIGSQPAELYNLKDDIGESKICWIVIQKLLRIYGVNIFLGIKK